MKKKNLVLSSTFLTAITCLPAIGLSSWFIKIAESDEFTTKNYDKKEGKPVAYIEGQEDKKYTTIEKALEVASSDNNSNNIYVIPGTNPTITRNCTVSTNDTLILPYEGTTYLDNDRESVTNDLFADGNLEQVNKNRKNLVTISSGVTITNNGTINIGGVLGTSTNKSRQRPTGHTAGNYVELRMTGESTISNYGTINCYGYIKADNFYTINDKQPEIQNLGTNSTINLPIVLYDYKGANFSLGAVAAKIMPFNIFDFPNSQVKMTFDKDAKLNSFITLYSDGFKGIMQGVQQETLKLIGQDSAIFKSAGGTIEMKYTPCIANFQNRESFTTADFATNISEESFNKTQVNIKGNFEFSSTEMTLAGMLSVNTAEYNLPFSYKFDIAIVSGESSINSKLKFLAGSKLTVNKNATLNINSETSFYTDYIDQSTYAEQVYPRAAGTSTFINNGTTNINSNFSGEVLAKTNNAILNISSNSILSTSIKELMTSSLQQEGLFGYYIIPKYKYVTTKAFGNISSNPDYSSPMETCFLIGNNYISNIDGVRYGLNGEDNTNETISEMNEEKISVFDVVDVSICLSEKAILISENGPISIKDLNFNDKVLTFNHFTSEFEYQDILLKVNHKPRECNIITLKFENTEIEVVNSHGFYNVEQNQYVSINSNNFMSYIGKKFLCFGNGQIKTMKLLEATATKKIMRGYAIITNKNFNAVCNELLNVTDLTDSLYNIYNYNKNYSYDKKDIKEKLNKYGYLEYELFKDVISKNIFDSFNGKYFKHKLLSGEITPVKVLHYLNIFKKYEEAGEIEFSKL